MLGQANNKPTVKDREELYRMIISQLFYDGHQSIAVTLSGLVKAHPACPPSDRLQHVVNLGLEAEAQEKGILMMKGEVGGATGPGLDLEFDTESQCLAPEPALYETVYVTSHKQPCRTCAFNSSGRLVATGSVDASIKILDVERMLVKTTVLSADLTQNETLQQTMETHPVIRTLYDHVDEVTCLAFHPKEQLLASGSLDCTIKLFDFVKPSVKRASGTIQEAEQVLSLAFHPTGDYLLVGTRHRTLRLYDVNTTQCFVSSVPEDQHRDSVHMVQYNHNGSAYTTCSADGDIKIWDGVSNKCIVTFPKAHDGAEVCSVCFSRNGKYVLSSGKDSLVKLWELSMTRCLIAYTGAGAAGKQQFNGQAVLNHTEDYVLFADEKTTSLCSWDARNAERQRLLSLGHNSTVRSIQHSPTQPAFMSCSDDFRARFWYRRVEAVDN